MCADIQKQKLTLDNNNKAAWFSYCKRLYDCVLAMAKQHLASYGYARRYVHG